MCIVTVSIYIGTLLSEQLNRFVSFMLGRVLLASTPLPWAVLHMEGNITNIAGG
jgi:hypothetical protein